MKRKFNRITAFVSALTMCFGLIAYMPKEVFAEDVQPIDTTITSADPDSANSETVESGEGDTEVNSTESNTTGSDEIDTNTSNPNSTSNNENDVLPISEIPDEIVVLDTGSTPLSEVTIIDTGSSDLMSIDIESITYRYNTYYKELTMSTNVNVNWLGGTEDFRYVIQSFDSYSDDGVTFESSHFNAMSEIANGKSSVSSRDFYETGNYVHKYYCIEIGYSCAYDENGHSLDGQEIFDSFVSLKKYIIPFSEISKHFSTDEQSEFIGEVTSNIGEYDLLKGDTQNLSFSTPKVYEPYPTSFENFKVTSTDESIASIVNSYTTTNGTDPLQYVYANVIANEIGTTDIVCTFYNATVSGKKLKTYSLIYTINVVNDIYSGEETVNIGSKDVMKNDYFNISLKDICNNLLYPANFESYDVSSADRSIAQVVNVWDDGVESKPYRYIYADVGIVGEGETNIYFTFYNAKIGNKKLKKYSLAYTINIKENISLSVWSSTLGHKKVSIYYNCPNNLFSESSTEYNYELSKLSSIMSMSAYWESEDLIESVIPGKPDKTNKYAKMDLETLGFKNIDDCGSYAKLEKLTEKDCHYVGYTFATKDIYVNNKKETVVAIIIKGTSGNEEWYSNFDLRSVGDENRESQIGDMHYGFETACNRLIVDFWSYVNKNVVTENENVKLWITGHSRGAGVGNIFAGKITDSGYYQKDNIYAYLYAPPAGTVTSNVNNHKILKAPKYDESNYKNIYNFINPQDFVPRMPLQAWGYGLYGRYCVFPNKLSCNPYTYEKYETDFCDIFSYLFGKPVKQYLFETGTGKTTELCNVLYDMVPKANNYYDSSTIESFVSAYFYFHNGVAKALTGGIANELTGLTVMESFISSDLGNLRGWLLVNEYFIAGSVFNKKVTYSHTPEMYVAWAYVCDDLGDFDDELFVKGIYACPVDIEVYDSQNNIVGRVVNNKVDESVTKLEIFVDEETSTKTVFMPVGEKFTVKAIGYDEGTMDCSLEICNITDLSTSDYRSVNDIAITPNTIVTSNTDFSGNMLITAVTDDGDKVTTVEYTIDPANNVTIDTETENKDGDDNNENDDNNNDDVDGNENNGNTNNENNFTPSRPSIPSNTSVNNSSNVPANVSTQKTISVKVENKITGKSSKAIGTRKNNEVSVKLGTENNGLYANVITDNGDFIEAVLIEKGKAKFDIPDDVNFRIVIDEFSYVEDVSSGSAVYEENSKVKNGSYVMVIIIVSLFGVGFVACRKRSYTRK